MSKLLEERQVRIDATLEQIDKKLSNVDVAIRDLNVRVDGLYTRIDNLSISLSTRIDDIDAKQGYSSINKQKKVVVANQRISEQIAKLAYQMYKDGILSDADSAKIKKAYESFVKANMTYAQVLNEYSRPPDSPNLIRINSARVRMNDNLINFIRQTEELGIKWKEDLSDNPTGKIDVKFIWGVAKWVTTILAFIAKIFTILLKGR